MAAPALQARRQHHGASPGRVPHGGGRRRGCRRPSRPGVRYLVRPRRRAVHPGLYVADASIIPTALGNNPLLTITALAERVAELLVRDPANPPSSIRLVQRDNGSQCHGTRAALAQPSLRPRAFRVRVTQRTSNSSRQRQASARQSRPRNCRLPFKAKRWTVGAVAGALRTNL